MLAVGVGRAQLVIRLSPGAAYAHPLGAVGLAVTDEYVRRSIGVVGNQVRRSRRKGNEAPIGRDRRIPRSQPPWPTFQVDTQTCCSPPLAVADKDFSRVLHSANARPRGDGIKGHEAPGSRDRGICAGGIATRFPSIQARTHCLPSPHITHENALPRVERDIAAMRRDRRQTARPNRWWADAPGLTGLSIVEQNLWDLSLAVPHEIGGKRGERDESSVGGDRRPTAIAISLSAVRPDADPRGIGGAHRHRARTQEEDACCRQREQATARPGHLAAHPRTRHQLHKHRSTA